MVSTSAVDADGDGDHQTPAGVEGRAVDRRPQCALAGDDPDETPLVVDHGGDGPAIGGEQVEQRVGVDAVLHRRHVPADHGVELGEAVESGGVGFLEDAHRRASLVDDDHGAVGSLVDQRERVADRMVRRQRDRRLVQRMAALHVVDHVRHDIERDVLREHGEPTAPGDGLGHPAASDGGHVGDDDGDRRADAVGRREVDVEA